MCMKMKQYRNMANWFWGSRRSWRPPENCGERREWKRPAGAWASFLLLSLPEHHLRQAVFLTQGEGNCAHLTRWWGGGVRQEWKIPGKATGTEGTHQFSLLEPGLSPPESGHRPPFSVCSMQPVGPTRGQSLSYSEIPRSGHWVLG